METVIEEIAKQLGMAVDQAGKFIETYLPQYAGLKAMQATVPMVVAWSVFALCLIVFIVSGIILLRMAHKEDAGGEINVDIALGLTCACGVSGVVGLILLLIAIVGTLFWVPDIIGWSEYPEGMLIDAALNAVS